MFSKLINIMETGFDPRPHLPLGNVAFNDANIIINKTRFISEAQASLLQLLNGAIVFLYTVVVFK